MRLENTRTAAKCPKDLLAIPLFENNLDQISLLKEYDKNLFDEISTIIQTGDFKGKVNTSTIFYRKNGGFKRVLLVGGGKKREFTTEKLQKLVAVTDAAAQSLNIRGYAIFAKTLLPFPTDLYRCGKACAEAIVLSRFEFDQYKSKKEKQKKELSAVFWAVSGKEFQNGLNDGMLISRNINTMRELISMPSNSLTPVVLADRVKKLCNTIPSLKCTIFDEKKIEKLGMNGVLFVAKGSANPPRFIIIEYDGQKGKSSKKKGPIVLVGKGVTFDSGGISIKPAGGMEKMKYDMSGAAAVVGIIKSVAELGLAHKVIGVIPAVENMPSGTAYKPGDVITMASGTTVEVISTDAEGRLILADALHYACENFKPQAMIDLATLTGACSVALGNKACGLMGNNRRLIRFFLQNAENSGEKVWELPLWEDYDESIKSDIADIKNSGSAGGGTIVGGIFLKKFVKNVPWVHLDIANMAWTENNEKGYLGKGATGFGIRLVCHILQKWNL